MKLVTPLSMLLFTLVTALPARGADTARPGRHEHRRGGGLYTKQVAGNLGRAATNSRSHLTAEQMCYILRRTLQ